MKLSKDSSSSILGISFPEKRNIAQSSQRSERFIALSSRAAALSVADLEEDVDEKAFPFARRPGCSNRRLSTGHCSAIRWWRSAAMPAESAALQPIRF